MKLLITEQNSAQNSIYKKELNEKYKEHPLYLYLRCQNIPFVRSGYTL